MSLVMNDPPPQIVQCLSCGIKTYKETWDSLVPPACPRCGNLAYAKHIPKSREEQEREAASHAKRSKG